MANADRLHSFKEALPNAERDCLGLEQLVKQWLCDCSIVIMHALVNMALTSCAELLAEARLEVEADCLNLSWHSSELLDLG